MCENSSSSLGGGAGIDTSASFVLYIGLIWSGNVKIPCGERVSRHDLCIGLWKHKCKLIVIILIA